GLNTTTASDPLHPNGRWRITTPYQETDSEETVRNPLHEAAHPETYDHETSSEPNSVSSSREPNRQSAETDSGTDPTTTGGDQAGDDAATGSTDEQTAPDAVDHGDLEYPWVRQTDVSMSDVGGMEDVKEELDRDIITPLRQGADKAEAFGIPLPNLLLYGPPGTGKTFLAKALATELELPFVTVSGSDVTSKWVNQSQDEVKQLFDEAELMAEQEGGAVVFLDELDAVLSERSGSQMHEEDRKVVNEFLNHLQETGEKQILFVGATNKREDLDDAATRAGRIDKEIKVGIPDAGARRAILEAQLDDRPYDISDDVFDRAVDALEGAVAADIEAVVVQAARYAAYERDGDAVKDEDLIDALEAEGYL
ncbi:MAG: 26S protease regulatory subunit, partial [Halobacteriaceae archaeon]